MKEILALIIIIGSTFQVSNDETLVRMINFTGTAESEYFQGEVLPGGVDTQTQYPDGFVNLSARYMLKGVDANGQECLIYVNNEITRETPPGFTTPKIVTDSPLLDSLTRDRKLLGKIGFEAGNLKIQIFDATEQE